MITITARDGSTGKKEIIGKKKIKRPKRKKRIPLVEKIQDDISREALKTGGETC